jgi:hypothetical protein
MSNATKKAWNMLGVQTIESSSTCRVHHTFANGAVNSITEIGVNRTTTIPETKKILFNKFFRTSSL